MSADLPPGWSQHVSRSTGAPYWFNSATGESLYHPPPLPAQPPAKRARVEDAPGSASAPLAAGGSSAAAALVAAAYDARSDAGGLVARAGSSILHLRALNNWVKAVLIASHAAPLPPRRVLDLACGKCGDLAKWRLAGAMQYCGVDISLGNVRDGAARFNAAAARGGGGGGGGMRAKLVRADLGATSLRASGVLAAGEFFDAVSVQFALHYFFESEGRALRFFRNVADALVPGGVLLGTLPDAAVLVRRLRDAETEAPAAAMEAAAAGEPAAVPPPPLGFGNSLFRVRFPPAAAARTYGIGDAPYGLPYDFYLVEAVEEAASAGAGAAAAPPGAATEGAGGVREYLVPWTLLARLAAAAGLEPLAADNFHDFFERAAREPAHRATLRSMRVLDCEGTLSEEEWETAGIYRVFAFRKVRAADDALLPPAEELWPGAAPPAAAEAAAARAAYRETVAEADIVDLMAA